MQKVIPPEREPEILARYGRGETTEAIAAWLTLELGRKIHGKRVREFLERKRQERAPIAAAVIAEKVTKTVGADLDALDTMVGEAGDLQQKLADTGDLRGAIQALNAKAAILTTRLKMSGAGDAGRGPLNISIQIDAKE